MHLPLQKQLTAKYQNNRLFFLNRVMGRGESSDVNKYTISNIKGREFTATLRPTGS